jgi:hypothetical protein
MGPSLPKSGGTSLEPSSFREPEGNLSRYNQLRPSVEAMSAFPNSPRLVKGGIVLVDPDSGAVQKIIVLQYNPDTLTRSCNGHVIEGRVR